MSNDISPADLHDATLAPLSILRSSRWRPRWPGVQTNIHNSPIIQYRAMILVSNPFRVKEFIEMVNEAVEGLNDNKIQDGCRFKGKTAELCYYPVSTRKRLLWCQIMCFRGQGIS
jgi:hypothetical protein